MHVAFAVFFVAITVVVVATVARRIGTSAPLLLVAVGAAYSLLPGVDPIHIDPDLILFGFLPPLLFAAASSTSLVDIGRDKRQILGLSILLVLFTAFGVALIAWKLLDVPFAAALALGAIVAPPDAVAATAIARRIGLPRRVVLILEGESLLNDATALSTVNIAKVLIGGATLTWYGVTWDVIVAAVGGVLIGYVAYRVIAEVRKHIQDTITSVALSFLTPWVAYLPAERIDASGVVAVVIAGLLLAHEAPLIQTAQSRVSERTNWASITFMLENTVFLLIGLQVYSIVDGITNSRLGATKVVLISLVVLVTVIALRPIYLAIWQFVNRFIDFEQPQLTRREALVASWAGMRGVVTIAAAFLLPENTPERDAIIFIALVVTVGTLLLQGFSLGWVAGRLGLHAPDPREDALQQAQLVQAAVTAGRSRLGEIMQEEDDLPEEIVRQLRQQGDRRANLVWERLGGGLQVETPTQTYRRLRMQMLQSERAKVLHMRDKGVMDHEVLDEAMRYLDVEESTIAVVEDRTQQVRRELLLTPESRTFDCDHLQEAPVAVDPLTPEGCPDCAREGTVPVHLRLCLTCGNVGCCDSSVGLHADRHFRNTGHPVMRSFEPGEGWRWCYVDKRLG
ncbi:Na+/H+ antiporter [Allobranchiibius sp. GilTou73]|uniref:Na+/H+ antiporter n=1 Tax=Allobranchiibius sp. GilTou73 TaxID=2904523 RepID=UPI001F364F7C|nr:Na+/H+ antiporter [Allobranchiibius sp. GilTou73]UIJ34666.1 Na+/H+ antiporter [Allobranchiibius sp. GilTou73]